MQILYILLKLFNGEIEVLDGEQKEKQNIANNIYFEIRNIKGIGLNKFN